MTAVNVGLSQRFKRYNRPMSRSVSPPLPILDGITPSFVILPTGEWPSLLAFLCDRFPHLDAALLSARLVAGGWVDDFGTPFTPVSPYPGRTRIWYYRDVPTETPVPFVETILYRDDYLVVADKPHFLATIPAGRHLRETLLTRLRVRLGVPDITPIHRLDRETAGVVLFCLHPPSRGRYQQLFADRAVDKVYEAIAPYRAELALPCTHRSRMEECDANFTMAEVTGEPNSETTIALLKRQGAWARYRLAPHTGRKHQLRVHLAALGIPIANDELYPQLLPDKGDDFSRPLKLLARSIAFIDPISGVAHMFHSQRTLDW